jgi:hypothetical protein
MKTTRLLSTLILTVCLGFGSVMAQNAAPQVCPEKAEKPCKVKLTPEQRMEAQAQRMGKQLMLDDAKLAQFTSLYKEYLTALKECRPAAKENKVKPCERTDAQIQQDIEQRFEVRQKVLDTQKKYYASFKKILNARQLEKVFSMPRPGKMHKGNFPMRHGKMGKPEKMPAPGCPNVCPACPQAPQNK